MEEKDFKKVVDNSFTAYKVVKYTNPQGDVETGLWATTSSYSLKTLTERNKINDSGFLLTDKGECIPFPQLDNVSIVADCTEKQIDSINQALSNCNLSIKTIVRRIATPLGMRGPYGKKFAALFIKDADKVSYQMNGKRLTKSKLIETETGNNTSLGLYHDNGFSYISFTPLDTKKYLSAVNYALAKPVYSKFADNNGILLRWDDERHQYYVKCVVGLNKEYSEVSNT